MWPIQSGHLTECSDVNRFALAEPRIRYEERSDGSFVLSSMEELGEYDRSPVDWLVKWASLKPDSVFLAERVPSRSECTWRTVNYAQALSFARAIVTEPFRPKIQNLV